MRKKVGLLTKDIDVESFYVCVCFTLISSVLVFWSKGLTKFLVCVKLTVEFARFKFICEGFSKIQQLNCYKVPTGTKNSRPVGFLR